MKTISNIIASKTISNDTLNIKVLIGLPYFCSKTEDYYCEFQVLGAGDEQIRKAGGVSSFQAIECAILMVSSLLERLSMTK